MNSSWDGEVVHTILGHCVLYADSWPHFYDYRIWGISPILQITFLKCVLCWTNSFGGIRHISVTFLVSIFLFGDRRSKILQRVKFKQYLQVNYQKWKLRELRKTKENKTHFFLIRLNILE